MDKDFGRYSASPDNKLIDFMLIESARSEGRSSGSHETATGPIVSSNWE